MRTKTLLIAVAGALAAAITSSQAQTVYSQNVVGYVNTTLTGSYAFSMVCNPLNGTTNGAEQVMPGLTGGESLFVWTGHGYYIYTFQGAGSGAAYATQNGLSSPYQSDWTDGSAAPDSQYAGYGAPQMAGEQTDTADDWYWTVQPQLSPGQGYFVQNPNNTETNTYTGTVVTTNNQAITGSYAYSMVASAIPVGGNAETNTAINLTANFAGGESVFVWNGHGYYIYTYQGAGAGAAYATQNGLSSPYQSDWTDGSAAPDSQYAGYGAPQMAGEQTDTADDWYWTPALSLTVGQGFFVQNPNSTEQWSQTITNL
jgi:hypothetical protein